MFSFILNGYLQALLTIETLVTNWQSNSIAWVIAHIESLIFMVSTLARPPITRAYQGAEVSNEQVIATEMPGYWPGDVITGVLLLFCLGLVFYVLSLQSKLKIERYRLIRSQAKQRHQQQRLAKQEVNIHRLIGSNKELQETRLAFLNALADDLSNPISVIKNNYLEWFQQAKLESGILEKAMATESSISKIEQLIHHAQVAMIPTDNDNKSASQQQCSLSHILTRFLNTLQTVDGAQRCKLVQPEAVDFILLAEEQAVQLYLSFYLNFLFKYLPPQAHLTVEIAEQQQNVVIQISTEKPFRSALENAQPEREPGYFLITSLAQKLGAQTWCLTEQSQPNLLQMEFLKFESCTTEKHLETDSDSAQIYFEAFQEPVLDKSGPNSDSPKCLILDPCPEIQMCLSQVLSQHFECKGMFNLQSGLKKLIDWHPDLLIMEPVQGKDNIFDLLPQIQQRLDLSHIPMMVLTSRDTTENRLRALDFNIHTFFGKPFNKQLVYESALRLHKAQLQERQHQEVKENVNFQVSRDAIFLSQLNKLIETQIDNPDFRFEDYFEQFALSKRQFFRRVNSLTRCTPKQYLIEKRLELARYLLGKGCLIEEVAQRCGFKNPRSLLKVYQVHFGEEPV